LPHTHTHCSADGALEIGQGVRGKTLEAKRERVCVACGSNVLMLLLRMLHELLWQRSAKCWQKLLSTRKI
jgi:hypothetical protein